RVAGADRRHFDDLTVEKLHTIVLGENPELGHPVILVHGEPSPLQLQSHHARPVLLFNDSPQGVSMPQNRDSVEHQSSGKLTGAFRSADRSAASVTSMTSRASSGVTRTGRSQATASMK